MPPLHSFVCETHFLNNVNSHAMQAFYDDSMCGCNEFKIKFLSSCPHWY